MFTHTAQLKDTKHPLLDRRVVCADGTGLLAADTAENQGLWPQQSSQKEGCGFSQIRLCALCNLHTGVTIDYRINLTNNILKQELPNVVIRVHLPNEGINKSVRQQAVVNNNEGKEVRGIKTLFPSHWTEADVKSAGQAVINQQGGIIKSNQIYGEYKGVKIEASLDRRSGIISTIFPAWEQ